MVSATATVGVGSAAQLAELNRVLVARGFRQDGLTRAMFEALWQTPLDREPGLRIPNMLDAAVDGSFKGLYVQGEDILQSDPDTHHVAAGLAVKQALTETR